MFYIPDYLFLPIYYLFSNIKFLDDDLKTYNSF